MGHQRVRAGDLCSHLTWFIHAVKGGLSPIGAGVLAHEGGSSMQ